MKNRKLFAILTLVAFMMTLAPAAFAATTNIGLTVPYVEAEDEQTVGALRITETEGTEGAIGSGDEIIVTLPSSAEFTYYGDDDVDMEDALSYGNAVKTGLFAGATVKNITKKSFTLELGSRSNFTDRAYIQVDFDYEDANGKQPLKVDITSGTGDFEVEVYSPDGGITNGKVALAHLVDGNTIATALSTEDIRLGETNELGTLRIVESTFGALEKDDEIELTLPDDITWDVDSFDDLVITTSGGFDSDPEDVFTGTIKVDENSSGYDVLTLTIAKESTGKPGVIEISGLDVEVDDDAEIGDIVVEVGGDATEEDIVLGSVVDYGIDYTADDVKTIWLGDESETLPVFYVEELSPGSIVTDGRTVEITLPAGFAWVAAPDISVKDGDSSLKNLAVSKVDDDGRTLKYTFDAEDFSDEKTTLKFKDGKITSELNVKYEGDVTITFGGTSNLEGEIKVAEAKSPIKVEYKASEVIVGKQAQAGAEIIISEVAAGKITANLGSTDLDLKVFLDEDFEFDGTPDVEVIEGDLDIDEDEVDTEDGDRVLVIPIKHASEKASTIKISNIEYVADRTPAEGGYDIKVGGPAVNRAYQKYVVEIKDETVDVIKDAEGYDWEDLVDDLDIGEEDGIKFEGIKVVTPAPGDKTAKSVVFTIDDASYEVDGVAYTMDIAPYVKEGRTYLPVRFAAVAVGVDNENVIWDNATQTVTILNDNKVVQLKIGSNVMTVNGTAMYMDAAPEVTSDRTMLPIRYVAQALGKTVEWDEATQTVTIK